VSAARATTRLRWRERWRRLHLWLALLLGAPFALLGLSGSVLVFYTELDRVLNPALAWQPAQGCVTTWEPVLQALRRAEPQRERGWRIELPEGGCGSITARYLRPPERAGAFFAPRLVSLRADTLEPVAQRYWGDFAATWLFDLHYTGLAGAAGRTVIGLLGLGLGLSLLSGLALWWPRSARQWRAAWRPKAGAARARRTWDQHRLAGLYALPLLLLLALSGALLALPEWVDPVLARWSKPLPVPKAVSALPTDGRTHISLDQALTAARMRFPAAAARWVDTPDGPSGTYRIRVQQPGEPSRRFPKTWVVIDAYNAQVLGVRDPHQEGAGDAFLAWLHPLHNGEAFRLPGRILACVTGLVLPFLWITGLRRWRDRARGRRAAATHASTAGPADITP